MRARTIATLTAVVVGALAVTRAARAEEPQAPRHWADAPNSFRLGGGGLVESMRGNDDPTYAGFFLAPGYRPSRGLSVGALLSYAWRPGSLGSTGDSWTYVEHRQLWRVGGELRFHPWQVGVADIWLAFDAGVVGARRAFVRSGFGVEGTSSSTQHGPSVGFGFGADLRVARALSFGVDMRARAMAFDSSRSGDVNFTPTFADGPIGSLTFGLVATYHAPLGDP